MSTLDNYRWRRSRPAPVETPRPRRLDPCRNCLGAGNVLDAMDGEYAPCHRCRGYGVDESQVEAVQGLGRTPPPKCMDCGGEGTKPSTETYGIRLTCPRCGGRGFDDGSFDAVEEVLRETGE